MGASTWDLLASLALQCQAISVSRSRLEPQLVWPKCVFDRKVHPESVSRKWPRFCPPLLRDKQLNGASFGAIFGSKNGSQKTRKNQAGFSEKTDHRREPTNRDRGLPCQTYRLTLKTSPRATLHGKGWGHRGIRHSTVTILRGSCWLNGGFYLGPSGLFGFAMPSHLGLEKPARATTGLAQVRF